MADSPSGNWREVYQWCHVRQDLIVVGEGDHCPRGDRGVGRWAEAD
jgi:hypothetical protein